MDERIDDALRIFRRATQDVNLPAGFVDAVARSIEPPTVTGAVSTIGRRVLFSAALVAAVLVFSAVGSLRALEHVVADYALSRGPS